MLSTELFKKIRQIEIRTKNIVNDSFAGEYHSVFKGRGMEFDEVRPYQPGDEIRTIDWNVTARMGDPYIKRYIEERELTVLFLVDASGSKDFGTVDRYKRELAAELTAVLAFAATNNNDKVGLLIFTDQVELFIPPRKGRTHVLRIIRELLTFEPEHTGTDIQLALDTANRILKRRAILFLISDLLTPSQSYQQSLNVTNRRHDLIAIQVTDPLEEQIAPVGVIGLEDAETGKTMWVDTSSKAWRTKFAQSQAQNEETLQALFRRSGVDRVLIQSGEDYVRPLIEFFRKRTQRKKKG